VEPEGARGRERLHVWHGLSKESVWRNDRRRTDFPRPARGKQLHILTRPRVRTCESAWNGTAMSADISPSERP
jgi:hypothetical protein